MMAFEFAKNTDIIYYFINYMKSKLELRIVNEQVFVGFQIKRDGNFKDLMIHQSKYIQDYIKQFNMENCMGICYSCITTSKIVSP